MKPLLLTMIFLISIPHMCAAVDAAHVEHVRGVIAELMEPAPNRSLSTDIEEQRTLAAEIVAASDEYQVDRTTLTLLAFLESSFRTEAVGEARQEIGILQLHGVALRGCPHDMTERAGQLRCGARWYRRCLDHCNGDERGALTAYATGACHARTEQIEQKISARLRKIERWR